ncbi:hypothetical protein BDZ97DRAFT_1827399 [Flammula alnicola]|nr:hypothetical protein BDZ97DRAFT_1827399 [Flammula alnicola]
MYALCVFLAGVIPAGYSKPVNEGTNTNNTLAANVTEGANNTLAAAPSCYWDGTAPFCAGHCGDPYVERGRDSCGDGACCWTGYKVYCCLKGA